MSKVKVALPSAPRALAFDLDLEAFDINSELPLNFVQAPNSYP
jgi:hypothetical protein